MSYNIFDSNNSLNKNIYVNTMTALSNVLIDGNLTVAGTITDGGGLTGITGSTGYFQNLTVDELVFHGASGITGTINVLTVNDVVGVTGAFSGLLNVNGGISGSTGTLNNLNTILINGQNGVILDLATGEIPLVNVIAGQPWAIGGSEVTAPNKVMTIGYNGGIDRGQIYSFDQALSSQKDMQYGFPTFPCTHNFEGSIIASNTGDLIVRNITCASIGCTGGITGTALNGSSLTVTNLVIANGLSGATGSISNLTGNTGYIKQFAVDGITGSTGTIGNLNCDVIVGNTGAFSGLLKANDFIVNSGSTAVGYACIVPNGAIATTITVASTLYENVSPFFLGTAQNFSLVTHAGGVTGNTIQYNGSQTQNYKLDCQAFFASGATGRIESTFYKNGAELVYANGSFRMAGYSVDTSGSIGGVINNSFIISLAQNDQLQYYITNIDNAGTLTLTQLNLTIVPIYF